MSAYGNHDGIFFSAINWLDGVDKELCIRTDNAGGAHFLLLLNLSLQKKCYGQSNSAEKFDIVSIKR